MRGGWVDVHVETFRVRGAGTGFEPTPMWGRAFHSTKSERAKKMFLLKKHHETPSLQHLNW